MLLRSLVLAAVLLAPLPPAAGAAPFTVDWGGAVGMTANGWHVKADPPGSALCGWEGGGTVFFNTGALGTNQGCHYVFDAPGAAAISGVAVSYDFNRAHASPSLCLRSFMGGTSTAPLTRCTSVSGAHETVLGAASTWIQLGLFYTGAPTSIGTARANNAVLHSGSVMLDDPTPPSVPARRQAMVTGTSFALPWSATDPESSIGLAAVPRGRRAADRRAGRRLPVALAVRRDAQRARRSWVGSGRWPMAHTRSRSWPARPVGARRRRSRSSSTRIRRCRPASA